MRIGCVWETLACLTAAIMVLNSCTTAAGEVTTCSGIVPMVYRNDKISITDFGGIGDGRTLNTKAFNEAIYRIKHLRRRGGTLLYIPPGVYLTQSFNLTSRMTLYLAKGAVIKATQVYINMMFSSNQITVLSILITVSFSVQIDLWMVTVVDQIPFRFEPNRVAIWLLKHFKIYINWVLTVWVLKFKSMDYLIFCCLVNSNNKNKINHLNVN